MLSGVNLIQLRIQQELILISYRKKEGEKCVENTVEKFPIYKKQFST